MYCVALRLSPCDVTQQATWRPPCGVRRVIQNRSHLYTKKSNVSRKKLYGLSMSSSPNLNIHLLWVFFSFKVSNQRSKPAYCIIHNMMCQPHTHVTPVPGYRQLRGATLSTGFSTLYDKKFPEFYLIFFLRKFQNSIGNIFISQWTHDTRG